MTSFRAHLDYETSSRAGMRDWFQVVSIVDENDTDYTKLVDQGKHYLNLSSLKEDFREALKKDGHLDEPFDIVEV